MITIQQGYKKIEKAMVRFVMMLMIGFANVVYGQITTHGVPTAMIVEDSSQQYFVLSSLPVNQLKPGEMIAVPFPGDAQVIDASIISGQLPAGTTLYPNGLVVVSDSKLLEAGSYQFTIETRLANNEIHRHELNWQVVAAKGVDRDAIFFVSNKRNVAEYVNGEMLAHAHDPDGDVSKALVVRGTLPKGTSLTSRGNVVVNNHHLLETGTYHAWIATQDARHGISLFALTLYLENTPVAGN